MKGAVLAVLLAVALTNGAVFVNKNARNSEDDIPVGNNHDEPSQAPRICSALDSSGVVVAHENCNQFYKCTFGHPVPRSCPSNLLFDPTRDRCEWPEIVNCGNRIIPEKGDDNNDGGIWEGNGAGNDDPSQAPAICAAEGSDHIYIAHENCNQYYKCWAGKPVALPCPTGFLFNPKKDYCDFPYNVECGNRVIPDKGDDDNQGENDNGNQEDDIPIGNNYDDPSQASVICGRSDSSGVLVAHENCNEFYKCTFNLPVARSCPGNLLFDPTRDRCEWPNIVNCGNRIIPEKGDDNNDNGIWEGNGAGNDDPSQAPAICAAEGSDHIYIAHENCNQYYKCWDGKPVALPCPTGFLFNPKKDYCDFPFNVECGSRVIPDIGDDDNQDGNDNGNQEDDIPIGNNYDDPSQASVICGRSDSSGVLVAHENCNEFYKCTFNLPVARSCPGNLLFDPTRDRCEWPDIVNCGNRIIPEKGDDNDDGGIWEGNGAGNDDPSQAPAICAAEGSDHIYIAHENCNQYYKCWAGKPVALPCPSGYLFNPKKDYCDFPRNVDCGSRVIPDNDNDENQGENDNGNQEDDIPSGNNYDDPSQAFRICSSQESTGVLIAHENCNQFYTCNFGLPVAQWCPGKLLFDPTRDRCEWADIVTCGNRIIPENDDDNDGGVWEGNGAGNDDPSQAPAICAAEGSDNTYVAHEICSQYYKCWAGKPVTLPCPSGFFFNPKKDYCDFPKNVDCANRLTPVILP